MDASPQDEVTALHIASFKGHKDIIRYLCVAKRLTIDVQDTVSFIKVLHALVFILVLNAPQQYIPSGWNHLFDVCGQARTL